MEEFYHLQIYAFTVFKICFEFFTSYPAFANWRNMAWKDISTSKTSLRWQPPTH